MYSNVTLYIQEIDLIEASPGICIEPVQLYFNPKRFCWLGSIECLQQWSILSIYVYENCKEQEQKQPGAGYHWHPPYMIVFELFGSSISNDVII